MAAALRRVVGSGIRASRSCSTKYRAPYEHSISDASPQFDYLLVRPNRKIASLAQVRTSEQGTAITSAITRVDSSRRHALDCGKLNHLKLEGELVKDFTQEDVAGYFFGQE